MPGSPLNITLPSVATDDWPTWASRVVTALSTIISDLEPQVTSSEINVNANLPFNGYSATDLTRVTFRAGVSTQATPLCVGFKNGDLFACDGNGNEIQMTSNGAPAGTGNGFLGDTSYASYSAAGSLYSFLDSGGAYDSVRVDNVRVSNGTNYAEIGYGGSVNTTFTLPATAPAGVSVLTIDALGQVAHDANVGVDLTFSNADIVLTGTSAILFPDTPRNRRAASTNFYDSVGTPTTSNAGSQSVTGSWTSHHQLPVEEGERFKNVVIRVVKGGSGGSEVLTATVYTVDGNGTRTAVTGATGSISTSGTQSLTLTASSPTALAPGETIVVDIAFTSASANTIYRTTTTVDRA